MLLLDRLSLKTLALPLPSTLLLRPWLLPLPLLPLPLWLKL